MDGYNSYRPRRRRSERTEENLNRDMLDAAADDLESSLDEEPNVDDLPRVRDNRVPRNSDSGAEAPVRQESPARAEAPAQKEKPADDMPRVRDNRVPTEARRMSAAPYGTASARPEHRRPGTRPLTAPPRPVQNPARPHWEGARRTAEPEGTPGAGGIRVGYAPGRMEAEDAEAAAMREGETQRIAPDVRMRTGETGPLTDETRRIPGEAAAAGTGERRPIKVYPEDPYAPVRPNANQRGVRSSALRDPEDDRRGGVSFLRVLVTVLLVIGVALMGLLMLPKDNSLRAGAAELVSGLAAPVENALGRRNADPARITSFDVTGDQGMTAPCDVTVSVTTETGVADIRLTDADGNPIRTDQIRAENADDTLWMLTMRVEAGYEGLICLQVHRENEAWQPTEYSAEISVAAPPVTTQMAEVTEEVITLVPEFSTQEPALTEETVEEILDEPLSGESLPDESLSGEDLSDESLTDESLTGETLPEDGGEDPEAAGPDEYADPADEFPDANATLAPVMTPAPTEEVTATPAPTPTPALTAESSVEADPAIITTSRIYDLKKRVTEYSRPARELIHMPVAGEYSKVQLGVLTFRGDAFRQNAAAGTVDGASALTVLWDTAASSARGASQTYYGIGWPGQAAIVKWSKQVRESANNNIYSDLKEKSGLKEVIQAGMDGMIYFLDLETGKPTRNAIKTGYPIGATPSVHPGGYPYMNVGQFARKMKSKTYKVGLHQFNLYNQKELTLIDGLDNKYGRAQNGIGTFNTSSLIDRTSDTVIAAGTNGLLYLQPLNSEFDWQAGTYKMSPSTMVLAQRAKTKKTDAMTAVESSLAMYDKYVFWADMGGIVRCVDTNLLTAVWAVDTGDAVMAAVALDLPQDGVLDLYTANMLDNRKKGPAQIRKLNALNGKAQWQLDIGVAKNSKTKDDVGVKASPLVGQNSLKELVYFTVTGLNDEGRETLGLSGEEKSALVALEKATGAVRWVLGMEVRSESSPVAVYDEAGTGWVIQCAEDGTIYLLDGLTGRQVNTLKVEGEIVASPAVYNDMMIIGTTGKNTEHIYGIRIEK